MAPRHSSGFTLVELLVCLVVIAGLIYLALPRISCGPVSGARTQTLSNMKQLHLATENMTLDGVTTGNTNLGWPGDTGSSFAHWTTTLVKEGYLSTHDLAKLLSGPGRVVPVNTIPIINDTAVLVYAVGTISPGNTVFLSSANFTNTPTGGLALNPAAKPYGDKGFVVMRKAGDGAILLSKQVGYTNIIGAFVSLCH